MKLTPEQVEPLQGSDFHCEVAEGAPVVLRLQSVKEAGAGQGFRQFSLHFSGPLDTPLIQGTYEIHHPVLGDGPLFIVPVAREAEQMCYEAACSCRG